MLDRWRPVGKVKTNVHFESIMSKITTSRNHRGAPRRAAAFVTFLGVVFVGFGVDAFSNVIRPGLVLLVPNLPSKVVFIFGAFNATCQQDDIGAPNMNLLFEGKFRSLNQEDEVWSSFRGKFEFNKARQGEGKRDCHRRGRA